MDSFYSVEELMKLGLRKCGKNVLLSRKASIYNASEISIGDNSRIDDFSILSGNIIIGNHVHLAAGCALFGANKGIHIEDFAGFSFRCVIFATSEDYSGMTMTNPTVPAEYRNVYNCHVHIGKHVLMGAGSIVLPGVVIGEGCSIGAASLVNRSIDPWGIYAGIPCKRIKERSKELLDLEKQLNKSKEIGSTERD